MTASSPPDRARDNHLNTELLAAELPAARYVDEAYLRWLYDENPYGPAIQRGVDDDGVRVAHYALIPQRYRGRDGVVPAAFSLHAVVRSGTQRKGYFQTDRAPRSTTRPPPPGGSSRPGSATTSRSARS